MKGIWRSAWVSLRRKGLRSLLTVSSIAIGTAMVVLVLCIGQVGTQAVNAELESMGINGLSVSASDGLTVPCLTAIRGLDAVSEAMPLSLQFASAQVEGSSYAVVGCGIDAGADQVISLQLLQGRLLNRGDVSGEESVCVVDEAFAREVYGRVNVVGQSLTLVYQTGAVTELTVVGVTATGSSLLQNVTALIPYMVYMPYTTQQTVTGMQIFDQIAVRLTAGTVSEEAEKTIRRTLDRMGEPMGTVMTENLATQRERLDSLVDIVSLALTAVSGVSLLVSGFGILTVMLSSVNERTREIGIKKAIGATRRRIWLEFLVGALLLSFFGAVGGLLLGGGAVLAGCLLLGYTPVFPLGGLAAVFLITLALGMAFGAYPAYQAAGMRPVEALRYEG
ncbi:MAG: ABC transporter permease [Clostridia bacterium]|nr:ABC transporter permease [Clostridia bacterium]